MILNSGAVTSVWPSGAVRFFQGSNLPLDQSDDDNLGVLTSYVRFPGETHQTDCTLISFVQYLSQSGNSFVSLSLPVGTSLNIIAGDNYEIWSTQSGCLHAAGLI